MASEFVILTVLTACSFSFFLILRNIVPYLGNKYFGFYKRFGINEKLEFDTRITSIVHSLFMWIFCIITYFSDEQFYKNHNPFYVKSVISKIICFTIGYMVYDIWVVLYKIFFLNLYTSYVFVAHHLVVIVLGIYVCCFPNYHLGVLAYGFTEFTTFFVGNAFMLPLIGLRETLLYKINATLVFVFWILVRFGVGFFYIIFCFIKNWNVFMKRPRIERFLVLLFPSIINLANIYWFRQIVETVVRIFKGKKTLVDESTENAKV